MSIIKNREELETNELRKDALDILESGLEAIQTDRILKDKVILRGDVLNLNGRSFDLASFNKIIFVGIGKCAYDGARAIEEILGDKITEGIALDVKFGPLKKIKSTEGTHPYTSEQNIKATQEILKLVKDLTSKDLVLVLVSGGGSALFELPEKRFSVQDIVKETEALMMKGANIYELNAVRKEMSQVKCGKFAEACAPAKVISLIFSDVLNNDISIVASGPTVLDNPGERVRNFLIACNHNALNAMQEKAIKLGYKTRIETETLSGNAAEVGKKLSAKKLKPKECLLFGGETTVMLKSSAGKGGRNQEVALSALSDISKDTVLIAAASDGWDNTEHAGALVDNELLNKSLNAKINIKDYLKKSDSFNFFASVGGAIQTGRLSSNVSDLFILIRSDE